MALYNLTNITGANGNPLVVASAVNDLTGGLLGLMLAVSLFIIAFIAFKNYPAQTAFAASGFITSVICIPLLIVGLVGTQVMVLFTILTAIGVVVLIMT